jgi:hypothetical protein
MPTTTLGVHSKHLHRSIENAMMKLRLASFAFLVFTFSAFGCGDKATLVGELDAAIDISTADLASAEDLVADLHAADAGVVIDTSADATPLVDSAPPNYVNLPLKNFVVDSLLAPTSTQSAAAYGVDLDGDGTIDNALGEILVGVGAIAGSTSEIQDTLDETVNLGNTLLLLRLHATDFQTDPNAIGLYWPAKTQTCCTKTGFYLNLTDCIAEAKTKCFNGSHAFTPATTTPTLLQGELTAGTFDLATPRLQFHLELTYAGTLDFDLLNARIQGTIDSNNIVNGRIVGAIPESHVARVASMLLTNLYQSNNFISNQLGTMFDTNNDGVISQLEITSNGLAKALLNPDVDLDNDGKNELSFGVGFTAVGAQIP